MAEAIGAAVIAVTAVVLYVRARPRVTKIMLVSGGASSRRYQMAFIGYSGRRPYVLHTQNVDRATRDTFKPTTLEIRLP